MPDNLWKVILGTSLPTQTEARGVLEEISVVFGHLGVVERLDHAFDDWDGTLPTTPSPQAETSSIPTARTRLEYVLEGIPNGKPLLEAVEKRLAARVLRTGPKAEAAWNLRQAILLNKEDRNEFDDLVCRATRGRSGECRFPIVLGKNWDGAIVEAAVTLVERRPSEPALSLAPWSQMLSDETVIERLSHTCGTLPWSEKWHVLLALTLVAETWPGLMHRPVFVENESLGLAVFLAIQAAFHGWRLHPLVASGVVQEENGELGIKKVESLACKALGIQRLATMMAQDKKGPLLCLVAADDRNDSHLRNLTNVFLNRWQGIQECCGFDTLKELCESPLGRFILLDELDAYLREIQVANWDTSDVTGDMLAETSSFDNGRIEVALADTKDDPRKAAQHLIKTPTACDRILLPLALKYLSDTFDIIAAVLKTLAAWKVVSVTKFTLHHAFEHHSERIRLIVYDEGYFGQSENRELEEENRRRLDYLIKKPFALSILPCHLRFPGNVERYVSDLFSLIEREKSGLGKRIVR